MNIDRIPYDARMVVQMYDHGHSIREIAADTGFSHGKVKKILITYGMIQTDEQALLRAGKTVDQIAEITGQSTRVVNNKIGYTKGMYRSVDSSANAKRIRRWRSSNP